MKKLFVTDNKGYQDTYRDVWNISIKKIDNKNTLEINYNSYKENDYIALKDIRGCYLVDINGDDIHEYFRYEK